MYENKKNVNKILESIALQAFCDKIKATSNESEVDEMANLNRLNNLIKSNTVLSIT